MNLMLLRSGYSIVVIQQRDRVQYIDGLVVAQQQQHEDVLLELMTESVKASFVEMLGIVATAGENRGKELAFYDEMIAFLTQEKRVGG